MSKLVTSARAFAFTAHNAIGHRRKQLDREHIAKGDDRVPTTKLADLIDNAESIRAHDPRFAKVYLEEKRLLLDVLADGHPELLGRARAIVNE